MDKDIRYKEMIGYLKESKEFIFINIVTMVFISAFLFSEDFTNNRHILNHRRLDMLAFWIFYYKLFKETTVS